MSKPQILCFPQAGADSQSFMTWQSLIGTRAEIYPVALPGRGVRLDEPPLHNFEELCDQICSEIVGSAKAPFFVMGSSMGGWMAYEIAYRLEQRGLALKGIIVLCSPMPAAQQKLPELDNPETVAADIIGVNPVFEEVTQYPELLELILPTLRADFRMCNRYRPNLQHKVFAPILGFSGMNDTLVTTEAMRGWATITKTDFNLFEVAGDHSLHENPVAEMIEQVCTFLDATVSVKVG
ncbi:MAG: alpha/beta fold hydrolase [Litoreibacter sp.]